ncbi:MAG: DNA recombination protein RmuC [Rikenellaceae bacterium]|jgi:DNA recombination protein RmuC|nr:DNA recombination protein RmuC [Rikenellaceae bacterium]
MTTFYLISVLVATLFFVIWLTERKRAEKLLAAEKQLTEQLRGEVTAKSGDITAKAVELARAEAEIATLQAKAESDRVELSKLQESFRLEFHNLAGEILEEKSQQFKSTNKEAMETLLKPFKVSLDDFKKRVEEIHSEENRQHGSLKSELQHLMELNQQITTETTNLTRALKGNSKVQGDWGEMILERMLESSNLRRGVHYFVQENFKSEEGNNLRPDVVLTLPEGKRIVIDSKVSLTAYVALSAEEDEARREGYMKEHLASLRRHITELQAKNYQDLVDSPDFVIMFVPSEPAFIEALNRDNSLWSEAYNRKIIVSSPTNLFALLKIVDDLWKRDTQSRNYLEIARQGGALYDKFAGFVASLEAVGDSIERAQKSYDKALGQLKTGKGNLVTSSEKLLKLGVKASKKLPNYLVDEEDERLKTRD